MFDYEYLKTCEYTMTDKFNNEYLCTEPAIAEGWWDDKDGTMLLCLEHLKFILECEKGNPDE